MDIEKVAELNFESIVESSRDVIMRFDRQHRHLYVNQSIEDLTGIPPEQFIGKTHEEIGFPQDLCKIWYEAIEYVFENATSHRIEFILPNNVVIDWMLIPEKDEDANFNTVLTTARDISDIKNSEKQLIDNQNKFKDAFKLARLSTWQIDLLTKKVVLNEEFCDILGIPFDENNPFMESLIFFEEFVYADDRDNFLEIFRTARNAKEDSYQEMFNYRIVNAEGNLVWIMATVRTRFGEQGSPVSLYGTVQDITQIKATEEELATHKLHLEELVTQRTKALKQSERKLKDAVDLAKLSTWQFDIKTEKLTVSGVLEKKIDPHSFEEGNTLKLEHFIDTIHPDDFKVFYDAIQKALTTADRDHYDILSYRMYNADKELRYVNITVKVRFNEVENGPELLYGTIQDVTYLVESKIEKERLTSIIEATSDIVLISDIKGNILYVNEAGKQFFGYESNQGLQQKDVSKLFVDLREDKVKTILTIVDRKKYWIGEGRIKKFNDIIIPVSVGIVAHKNESNVVDCYSITLRDLSNQKKIENDLVYKNNELDTFVYRASHDLRGPIASLLGLYNVVKHEVHDPVALEFFEMYNDQILRLNETIIALIDLTRIKEQNASKEAVDVEQIVYGSVNSFKHLPLYSTIKFDFKINLDQPIVTDKSLINTIIQNMIENAIKYARTDIEPFVKITISMANYQTPQLVVNVEDNGIGIDKSIQTKVFDMFFRGDTQAIGSGLGLYILKNAVEKLQGETTLASEKGKGTSITVRIPVTIG